MDKLFILLQHILPKHSLSALMHKLARCKTPWVKQFIINTVIKQFGVNMSEAAQPDPEAYESFNAFFTRQLREDARPLEHDDTTIACPVDGTISQMGSIENGELFQAKGKSFNLSALLGNDSLSSEFEDGQFTTVYLSPKDYHRIHFPVDGTLKKMVHVPGELFSVNQTTVEAIDELFARNERVIAFFDTPAGPMAMVMVGAIFVSSIETVWYGEVTPPRHNQIRQWQYSDNKQQYKKNDEMARFNMGSTIVMLYGKDKVTWAENLAAGDAVQYGQVIAKINK
ncbi:archaetidylserine decarboxylase [Cycloclasticus sp. PY97N]|jgi:phosphatidylserine decarboxylase|uniref:archaetidylserine decarboxylase n=1 Tax=Cycloclasticus sp. PY97N TaxID=728003 RepID=UPI000BC2F8C4|nr:archaetidylserine decarboxylase [Cycloclasticus sp. PY97N]ATI02901.1 phosphatidylserine decarboxylase [Cycloclasticus sp. PY97N]|tara:strand:+ start:820 stop:1668 length:849 start_codon:yes stop_codon:yes gene_type:complete